MDLQAEIESRAARFGSVSTEIEAMKKQIAEDTLALKQATAIRENEAAAFRDEEKDLVTQMTQLKNAIQVLQKHQGAAMLQLDAPVVSALHSVIRDAVDFNEMYEAGKPQTKGTALLQTSQGALLKELGSP